MSLRNYRAFTMSEALAAVRRDLGADAVIMHTRTFTQGGFLGIGRRTVIEVTAARGSDVASVSKSAGPTNPAGAAFARARKAYDKAPPPPSASMLGLDKERTRLLAQAMSVTLDRERDATPRTAAAVAAAANAAATTRAATAPVAQRYVLVTPDRAKAKPAGGRATPLTDRERERERVRELLMTVQSAAEPPPAPPVVEIVRERKREPEPPRELAVGSLTVELPGPAPRVVSVAAPRPQRDDRGDLDAIDRLVGDVLRRAETTPSAAGPPTSGRLAELYATLIAQEVGQDLANGIIEDLRRSLSPEELASEHAVRSAALTRVAELLPASGGLAPCADAPNQWRRDGRPLTVAFVGPTGVGKTTTVAKIAATLKLRHGARIGLVTCDTYRIAAVEQLRTYAEIIGVPLEIALSPGHMRQAMSRLRDLDVVLIDTAGRSQNDADRLGELKALLGGAEPHETHLVLSSVASEKTLLREANAFAAVGIDKVVLTKLDEAAGLGAVMRVLRDIGRGISYITTGQEVPQHIESARPARLAEYLLSGVLGGVSSS